MPVNSILESNPMPKKTVAEQRQETVDKAEGLVSEAIEVLE